MKLEEWIAFYNEKTPEPFKRDERFIFLFRPDKGFCEYGLTDNMAIINQLAGDARWWRKHIEKTAAKIGVDMCGTWCIRNVLAYIRLFGYRIERTEELPDGLKRYHCRHKETGKKGLASPAFRYKTGEQAYLITWEA